MSDLETMAATVQGQHDALMVAQGLPTYDRLKRERDELQTAFEDAITRAEKAEGERDALEKAFRDTLHICISRGEKLGLDDKGPVLEQARAALAQVRK